jgi:hypothetical protein
MKESQTAGTTITEISKEIREQDKRLVRIETICEFSTMKNKLLPE